MNRDKVFDLFNGTRDDFVADAIESRKAVPQSHIRSKHLFLIAAVLALALLLMGCVAVFLGLQQRKIGEIPVTQKFDAYGHTVPEPEKTWYIATMSGFDNSPALQASREWNAFQQSYQSPVLTNYTDNPDIPNQYEYTYQCRDQAMVDKLNEIVEKYGLELLGPCALAQAWQQDAAFEALGLTHLVREDASAEAGYGACFVYPPYNFVCDVYLTLTGGDAPWTEEVYCEVYYLQSGYLAPNDTIFYDPEATQEWEYTTADGTKVLLALSGTDGTVLAQREDSAIAVRMDLAWKQGAFLDEGTALPTREALEQLADCFDYNVTTQAAPVDGLQEKFDAIPDPHAPSPEDFEAVQYASYAAYLEEHYLWPELVEYAFYDIDGNGEKDLITSCGDGFSIDWLTVRDGQVTELAFDSLRLCEGGIAEFRDPTMEQHLYYKLLGPGPEVGINWEQVHSVHCGNGGWKIDNEICTAQEAADFMAQYQPLQLDWQPLMDFPMDEAQETTFADVIAQEGSLSGDALLEYYGENYSIDKDHWTEEMAWFDLRDINGDGTDDLLLSIDGEYIDWAYTYKRGKLVCLSEAFYLCKDNVMHSVDKVDRYSVGVLERHSFRKLTGPYAAFSYQQLTHNLSTGVWTDTNYTQISEAEAQEILTKYSHVEMNMRPISELTGR